MMTKQCQKGTRNHRFFNLFEKRYLYATVRFTYVRSIILKIEGAEFNEKAENKATPKTCAKMAWKKHRKASKMDPQRIPKTSKVS